MIEAQMVRSGTLGSILVPVIAASVAVVAVAGLGTKAIPVAMALILVLFLVISDRVPDLVLVTMLVVVAANSSSDQLAQAAFRLRFVMYALVVVVVLARSTRLRMPPRMVTVSLGLLVVLACSSVAWSPVPSLTLQRAIGFALLMAAAFLFGANTGPRNLEKTLMSQCAGMTVLFVLGLLMAVAGLEVAYDVNSSGVSRYRGVLVNPNSVGLAVGVLLPLVFTFAFMSRGARKIGWLAAAAVMLISLVFSQSRGGLLATAVGMAVFLWRSSARSRWQPIAGLSLVALAAVAAMTLAPELQPSAVRDVVDRLSGAEANSAGGSGRLEAWGLAFEIWTERPLAGWGFGTAETVFGPRALIIEDVFVGSSPHNVFIQVLLELGPMGLVLILVALAAILLQVSKLPRSWLTAGVSGSLAAATITQFSEGGFISAGSLAAFLFWFVAGVTVQLGRLPIEGRGPGPTEDSDTGSGSPAREGLRPIGP